MTYSQQAWLQESEGDLHKYNQESEIIKGGEW